MVRSGEAEWNGDYMVIPSGLPKNDGQLVSEIVLEDRGPYPDEADPAGE